MLVDAGPHDSRLPLGGYASALKRALGRALRRAQRGQASAHLDLILCEAWEGEAAMLSAPRTESPLLPTGCRHSRACRAVFKRGRLCCSQLPRSDKRAPHRGPASAASGPSRCRGEAAGQSACSCTCTGTGAACSAQPGWRLPLHLLLPTHRTLPAPTHCLSLTPVLRLAPALRTPSAAEGSCTCPGGAIPGGRRPPAFC